MDLFLDSVVHVRGVIRVQLIDHNFVRQLYSEPVSIDSDFLDQISTFDAHFLFSNKMLDDNVRHVVSEGVTILVQPMHRAEDQVVRRYGTVLAPDGL